MEDGTNDEQVVGFHVPGAPAPESRFFPPTDRCPHPERWSATDADSTELEVSYLIGALVVALQPDLVVETGSAFGGTTERIVWALQRNGHGRLVTLETNPDRADYVRLRIPASPQWELVDFHSLTWLPPSGETIGLLFSDTARDIRCDEITHFWEAMGPGSIVAVHDAPWDSGGLRGWIENTFVKTGRMRAIDLPTPRGLVLLEVLEVAW